MSEEQGLGKTTTARIFANEINKGQGNPIEIDGASNNGVDNIRVVIDEAKFKPLDSDYKVYIIDECHMLSTGAWNAMLKLLEEPPKTTIFLLCTTDPQKIPKTILSRVQRYDFQRISFEGIVERLEYIIEQENIQLCELKGNEFLPGEENLLIKYELEAIEYIAKVADGGMRDAISLMDKCISYNTNLTVKNVVKALGISDYNKLDMLLSKIIGKDNQSVIEIVEEIYNQGKDLKQFIKQFIQYILDVCKYLIYQHYQYIQIPNTIDLNWYIKMEIDYNLLLIILDKVIELQNQIKYEQNPKILIESQLLLLCKGE